MSETPLKMKSSSTAGAHDANHYMLDTEYGVLQYVIIFQQALSALISNLGPQQFRNSVRQCSLNRNRMDT